MTLMNRESFSCEQLLRRREHRGMLYIQVQTRQTHKYVEYTTNGPSVPVLVAEQPHYSYIISASLFNRLHCYIVVHPCQSDPLRFVCRSLNNSATSSIMSRPKLSAKHRVTTRDPMAARAGASPSIVGTHGQCARRWPPQRASRRPGDQ